VTPDGVTHLVAQTATAGFVGRHGHFSKSDLIHRPPLTLLAAGQPVGSELGERPGFPTGRGLVRAAGATALLTV